MLPSRQRLFVALVLFSLLLVLVGEAKQPNPRVEGNQKQIKLVQQQEYENQRFDKQIHQNEIDDRIMVSEPYKSILQTSARFALSQTKLPNHINIDTAMNLINDAGFMLAKPSNLFKVIKVVAVTLATILTTTFFFPGANKFLETAWRDPINALNLDRYLSNGISEKSVIGIISSQTDDALSRVGLDNHSCRQRSLCYIGEVIKCSFPETSETIAKFANDNFSNTGYSENKYVKAFVSGFVDQNCTKISTEAQESSNCLGNFISSIISARYNGRSQQDKFQKIHALSKS